MKCEVEEMKSSNQEFPVMLSVSVGDIELDGASYSFTFHLDTTQPQNVKGKIYTTGWRTKSSFDDEDDIMYAQEAEERAVRAVSSYLAKEGRAVSGILESIFSSRPQTYRL